MECSSCNAKIADDARFCARCGSPAPAAAPALLSDPLREILKVALGRQYEIVRLLGKGGMGAVYLATEAALEREVAIKVLPPDRGATQDSRDRFRREARTAAKLSHANIVPLYTFGDVDGTLYFVMGYVKGESLAARLKREGRLSIEESRRILIEMAEALDYAHKLGIVHRDIKPDNVLIEEGTGRAMLMDFGVAKTLGAGQTMTEIGSVLGTPHYMSPEQAQGKADIDHRSDIYSLGVMGYAMLAGRLPFEGPTPGDVMVQHITREAPALALLAPGLPPEIDAALTRCLAKERDKRWTDARGFGASISDDARSGPLPWPLTAVWHGTSVAVIASVASAYVWANARMTPPPVDPLESRFLVDVLPRLTVGLVALATVFALGAALDARKAGHPWRAIAQAALLKPAWWFGFYPKRMRAKGDVWHRLPSDLRWARALFGWGLLCFCLIFPALIIISTNARNYYRLTGRETAVVRLDRMLKANKAGLLLVLPGLACLTVATGLLSRWKHRLGITNMDDRWPFIDTANRAFWSRPEVAAVLLPEGSGGVGRPSARSPRDLASEVSAALAGLGGPHAGLGSAARQTAHALRDTIASLDKLIAGLGRAFDATEAARIAEKLAALGPDAGAANENREARDILQKQLDTVRGLEARIEDAKARRAKLFELLKALWLQAVGLQAAGSDSAGTAQAADRMRKLLATVEEQAGGAKTIRSNHEGDTEAISDAPTIGR